MDKHRAKLKADFNKQRHYDLPPLPEPTPEEKPEATPKKRAVSPTERVQKRSGDK